jgi:hypothetical protein
MLFRHYIASYLLLPELAAAPIPMPRQQHMQIGIPITDARHPMKSKITAIAITTATPVGILLIIQTSLSPPPEPVELHVIKALPAVQVVTSVVGQLPLVQ